jgi:hypothetical protein
MLTFQTRYADRTWILGMLVIPRLESHMPVWPILLKNAKSQERATLYVLPGDLPCATHIIARGCPVWHLCRSPFPFDSLSIPTPAQTTVPALENPDAERISRVVIILESIQIPPPYRKRPHPSSNNSNTITKTKVPGRDDRDTCGGSTGFLLKCRVPVGLYLRLSDFFFI